MESENRIASPLETLRERFEQSSRLRTAGILQRHAHRLAPAERTAYESWLESATPSAVMSLRRRLLDRLLRGAALRRRSNHSWDGLSTLQVMPHGPYNDRAVLEETLRRSASADPQWTRELLDLYAGMDKIRAACQAMLPNTGKK